MIIEEFWEGAAIANSRDTVEFSRKNMFPVYKTVLNSRKNIVHV